MANNTSRELDRPYDYDVAFIADKQMSRSIQEARVMALEAMEQFPLSIRQALIADASFREKYHLSTEATLTFGNSGIAIQRSELFNAARSILAREKVTVVLHDPNGTAMELQATQTEGGHNFTLIAGNRKVILPNLSPLSLQVEVRLDALESMQAEVFLPESAISEWRNVLATRSLTDDEMVRLHSDLNTTPIRVRDAISAEMTSGTSNLSTLVPRSLDYFQRLVGAYDDSPTISAYAVNGAKTHITRLLDSAEKEGLLVALLLAGNPAMTAAIPINKLSGSVLLETFDWLRTNGDTISQIGAIELGLSLLHTNPEIEPAVLAMVEQILNEDIDGENNRFRLLSSLIMLVDGELSRTRTLNGFPPFWRRLAAIAHASLVERVIIGAQVDLGPFIEWAEKARAEYFYLQTMTDLRSEPRWSPDYVAAQYLQSEVISRIAIAAKQNEAEIKSPDARRLLTDEAGHLKRRIQFPFIYLPGPLEGGLESQNVPPPDILEIIERQLSTDVLKPESFIALVNSALIFRLGPDQATLATKALRTAKYQLRNTNDPSLLGSILTGLATVAAVSRSGELAEELLILVRRLRHDPHNAIPLQIVMHVGLTASAANSDLPNWCKFVGQWMTEMAFQSVTPSEADGLRENLVKLCHIVPELWPTCSQAEAALDAAAHIPGRA